MQRSNLPSLPALPGRLNFTSLVATAAGIALAGPATALGGAEFEAVLVPGAPFAQEGTASAPLGVDVNGQGQFVYTIEPSDNMVYVDAAGSEPIVTILNDHEYAQVRINGSGVVLRVHQVASVSFSTASTWSVGAGESVIEQRFFPEPSLIVGGVADDGTVFYMDSETNYFRWVDGEGSFLLSASPGSPTCTGPGVPLEVSPAGRAAATYGSGFFCTGGIGVVDWVDPESSIRLGPFLSGFSDTMVAINDAGLVCVGEGTGSVYDVDAGSVVDGFTFTSGFARGMDENGWIVSSTGILYRDGAYESLIDLVAGVDAIEYVYDLGGDGHFVARVTVGGESMMALLRPIGGPMEGDTNGDGVVDVTDLVNVVLCWGTDGIGCAGPGSTADVNSDGTVDVGDLVAVILAFGQGA